MRDKLREDGFPTRADVTLMSPAERAIRNAVQAVEAAGGSPALTEAVILLGKAQELVADHVEADNSPVMVSRCVRCRSSFTEEQIAGATACPSCGDAGVPMAPSKDVSIRINWHELRTLCIWAEWWAEHNKDKHPTMIDAVFAIAAAIQDQYPHLGPITFSGEVQEVRKAFPESKVEVHGKITEGAPMPETWDEVIDDEKS